MNNSPGIRETSEFSMSAAYLELVKYLDDPNVKITEVGLKKLITSVVVSIIKNNLRLQEVANLEVDLANRFAKLFSTHPNLDFLRLFSEMDYEVGDDILKGNLSTFHSILRNIRDKFLKNISTQETVEVKAVAEEVDTSLESSNKKSPADVIGSLLERVIQANISRKIIPSNELHELLNHEALKGKPLAYQTVLNTLKRMDFMLTREQEEAIERKIKSASKAA